MQRTRNEHITFLDNIVGTSHSHKDKQTPSITVELTNKLLGQQTPRGERRELLYTAVRHSIAELQHRR
jgi:hypothetical protein